MRQSAQEIKSMINEALDERFGRNVIGLTPGYHVPSGLTISPDGRVLSSNDYTLYSVRAKRSSSLTVPDNTETRLDWTGVDWSTSDTPMWTSGNPERLIAPVTGYYLLNIIVQWGWFGGPGTEMTIGERLIRVQRRTISGATVDDWYAPARALSSVTFISGFQANFKMKMTAGQYAVAWLNQNSGSSLVATSSGTYAALTLLGQ